MSPESKKRVKKLVLVLVTSTSVIVTRKEMIKAIEADETAEIDEENKESKGEYSNLAQVLCIRYPITFRKKSVSVLVLLDSGSKVNAIYPTFMGELDLPIRPTDVGAQKINNTTTNIFGMIVAAF